MRRDFFNDFPPICRNRWPWREQVEGWPQYSKILDPNLLTLNRRFCPLL